MCFGEQSACIVNTLVGGGVLQYAVAQVYVSRTEVFSYQFVFCLIHFSRMFVHYSVHIWWVVNVRAGIDDNSVGWPGWTRISPASECLFLVVFKHSGE